MHPSSTYQVLEDTLEVIVEWTNFEESEVEVFRYWGEVRSELLDIVGVYEDSTIGGHRDTADTGARQQRCTQCSGIVRSNTDPMWTVIHELPDFVEVALGGEATLCNDEDP